jgi:thiol-disulfide isomerase/thioredoxin
MQKLTFALLLISAFVNIDGSSTPADEYRELVRQHESDIRRYESLLEDYRKAKTDEERQRIRSGAPQMEGYSDRFLEFAQEHPTSPEATEALLRVVTYVKQDNAAVKKSIEILIRDSVRSEKLRPICDRLLAPLFEMTDQERHLRKILEENSHREVQSIACFNLALTRKRLAETARRVKAPTVYNTAHDIAQFSGKAALEQFVQLDPAALEAEAQALFQRVVDQYSDVPHFRRTLGEDARAELYELRELAIGKLAPEITGNDLDEKPMKLSDYRGRIVVIDFWGTWCGPCMLMKPQERDLEKRFEGKPFAIVGVNSDEDRDKPNAAMQRLEVNSRSWWDGGSPQGPIASAWNVHGWPTFYVVDRAGVIRYKFGTGDRMDKVGESLTKAVESLLDGANKAQ